VFSQREYGGGHWYLSSQNWHLYSDEFSKEISSYSGSDGRKLVLVRRTGDNGFIDAGRCGTEPRSKVGAGKVDQILTHVRNQESERAK
jgi:hypothetical protein